MSCRGFGLGGWVGRTCVLEGLLDDVSPPREGRGEEEGLVSFQFEGCVGEGFSYATSDPPSHV